MKRSLFMLALALLSSCGFFPEQPLKELSGSQLPNLIIVYSKWTGLSASSPISTSYALERQGDNFIGKVEFSAGGSFSKVYEASGPVSIPLEVVQTFLKELAKSEPVPGPYSPRQEWTDDYPSIYVEVEYPSKRFEFSSTSQGAKNIPWRLAIDSGAEQVINSGVPSDALDILRPYIPYEVLDEMIKLIDAGAN